MTERIVAVETSSAWTSVALADDGVVRAYAEHHDPRGHVEAIGVLVASTIAPVLDDGVPVTGVVCGVGPGPYSGLRVGVSYARALARGWNVPVVGVCSLDAVATTQCSTGTFLVTADARRREVYWAVYDTEGHRTSGPLVADPATLPGDLPVVDRHATARDLIATLDAWGALAPATWSPAPLDLELDDHGDAGARTARALDGRTLLPAEPLYLRSADITMPARGTSSHPVSAGVTWT